MKDETQLESDVYEASGLSALPAFQPCRPRLSRLPSRSRAAAQQLKQVRRREDADELASVNDRQRRNFSLAHEPGRLFDRVARLDDSDAAAHHLIDRPVEPEISDEQRREVPVGHDADDLALAHDDEMPKLSRMHPLQRLLRGAVLADRFDPFPHQLFDSQAPSHPESFGSIRGSI